LARLATTSESKMGCVGADAKAEVWLKVACATSAAVSS